MYVNSGDEYKLIHQYRAVRELLDRHATSCPQQNRAEDCETCASLTDHCLGLVLQLREAGLWPLA